MKPLLLRLKRKHYLLAFASIVIVAVCFAQSAFHDWIYQLRLPSKNVGDFSATFPKQGSQRKVK